MLFLSLLTFMALRSQTQYVQRSVSDWSSLMRSPIPEQTLQMLKEGMVRSEVVAVLGEPTSVWDERTWEYSSKDVWPMVMVQFDETGKLVKWFIDN